MDSVVKRWRGHCAVVDHTVLDLGGFLIHRGDAYGQPTQIGTQLEIDEQQARVVRKIFADDLN